MSRSNIKFNFLWHKQWLNSNMTNKSKQIEMVIHIIIMININNIWNPNLIYHDAFVFCSIPRLFVCLRMRMSSSQEYSNVYVECLLHKNIRMYTSNQYPYVRGPLRECRSIRSGASGLPYYCALLVCVSEVIELLAVWRQNKPKTKNQEHFLYGPSWAEN